MANRQPTFSTLIQMTRDRIHYRIEDRWMEFKLDQIQLIGEFTAPPGMLPADYFFSIKLRGIEDMLDIPAYTEGLFEVLSELRSQLPGFGRPALQMSTDFDSNVLWPAHVAGHKLFRFQTQTRPMINLPVLRNIAQQQRVSKTVVQEVMEAVF